jgi:hypothetical protein
MLLSDKSKFTKEYPRYIWAKFLNVLVLLQWGYVHERQLVRFHRIQLISKTLENCDARSFWCNILLINNTCIDIFVYVNYDFLISIIWLERVLLLNNRLRNSINSIDII